MGVMKVVRVLAFFFLLGSLSSGPFAKGSEDGTHNLPIHPAFHLQVSNLDNKIQNDKPTFHQVGKDLKFHKAEKPAFSSVQQMLLPQTEPESLDTMSQRDVVTPMTTVPTINPTTPATTTTPIYNPLPTPANPTPTMTPTYPDTTPTNPATNPYTTPTMGNPTSPTPTMGNPTSPTPTMGNPTSPTPTMGNPTSPTPTMGNPTSPTPTMGNPTSPTPTMGNPTSPTPTMGNPTSPTPTMGNPTSSGQSWCVASPSASETALQVALDYACGYGGADCSAIQQGGSCFNPDTVRDHASYAFNSYFQKNPVQTSCDFGGTAMITNTDPSTSSCQFSSSSTSSSTPNTTNPIGGGPPVFGSSPPDYTDTNSSSTRMLSSFRPICFLTSLIYLMVHK